MEQLGISVQSCVAVEDSVTGATAAVNAGITTFGYLGFADNPEVMAKTLLEKGYPNRFTG